MNHNITGLFRKESLQNNNRSLDGDVILGAPSSWQFIILLCTAITICSAFAIFSTIFTRTETVRGVLVSNFGYYRLHAESTSLINSLSVRVGDQINQGDQIGVLEPFGVTYDPLHTLVKGSLDADRIDQKEQQNRVEDFGSTVAKKPSGDSKVIVGQRTLLSAAIDGVVVALPVRPGQIVERGQILAVVSPPNAKLVAEIFVPSRILFYVTLGKSVDLRLKAFPPRKFGVLTGKIMAVSNLPEQIIERSDSGFQTAEPVYKVTVGLDDNAILTFGKKISLKSGMLLDAQLEIERHGMLEWLFHPINASKVN